MTATTETNAREMYEWTFDVHATDTSLPDRQATTPEQTDPVGDHEDALIGGWRRRVVRLLDLSTMLRIFGAGSMVAAIGVFLFQHWEAGNDLTRYSMLLAQTVLLCLLGFGTSRLLQEPKSARVFLALGLVSVAATFTILGALLYSSVQWDAVSIVYPGYAHWRIDSAGEAVRWIAGSVLLLVPVTVLGYLVLARPAAKILSGLFIANAALVLLPVRDPALTAVIAAGAGIASFMVLTRVRQNVSAVRTGEGRIARLIALLPIAIIAGRGGYLYAADAVSIAGLGVLVYATIRQMGVYAPGKSTRRRFLEGASLLPALVTALACAEIATRWVGHDIDAALAIAVLATVIVAALVDLAKRSHTDGACYARGAAAVGLLAGVAELAMAPSMGTALVCTGVSALVALYTRAAGFTVLYRVSLVCLVAGIGYHVYFAIRAVDLGGWMGLTLLGIIAIVMAAAIERHGEKMRALLVRVLHTSKQA